MRLAIMQPYFFPYIGYFQLIHSVDKFILYDKVNYIKKGWINRNRLVANNGNIIFIKPDLVGISSNKKIFQINFLNSKWKAKLIKRLKHDYKRAQFYNDIAPLIKECLDYETENLSEFNTNSIKLVCNYLEIKTQITSKIKYDEELEKVLANIKNKKTGSLLNLQFNDFDETKIIRILKICQSEKANTYINPINGKNLYSKNQFTKNKVKLFFINTLPYSYKQVNTKDFAPHLSIIDVLMNCGKEGTKYLLQNYELI